ncbi:MAG: polysaccharide biosynthesis/export family protein [Gemmatimonadales bacterium]
MRSVVFSAALLMVTAGSAPAYAQATAHGLRAGDMVRIMIWREPDLSGDFQVDEQGNVVFPKIGPMAVTRLSADSLKGLLVRRYTVYLRDPSIEVGLFRRVNVLGSVRSPGLYQVSQTETIADVLAKAGGPTSDGKSGRVELLRNGETKPIKLARNAVLFNSGVHSGDQLFVPARSWIGRNSVPLIGAGITATAIIVATVIKP